MNFPRKKKIVLLGMMSNHPVAGVIWQTVHYLVGFARLGYDVYYVEAHGITPTRLMCGDDEDGSAAAASFIKGIMQRFDLSDRWAYHALHSDGSYYGMNRSQLEEQYHSADLLINLHGATVPLPEHSQTGRLVYLETDPVAVQIEVHQNHQKTIDFLEPHCAFFTFGENYGNADCLLPVSQRFHFCPTRQPVIADFWYGHGENTSDAFTTIGNWQQLWLGKEVTFRGEVYYWSKHFEFMKFLDLPRRTNQVFELALSSTSLDKADRHLLESNGWRLRDALSFSSDIDAYRRYIAESRGEWTVAKDQNIRLRTGWFSDRAATYLAAAKPVVTQDTAFGNILPTGAGLFAFSTMDEAVQAIESINADYKRHSQAAFEIAREYFNYDVVLTRLLDDIGL